MLTLDKAKELLNTYFACYENEKSKRKEKDLYDMYK